jgi:cytochrome c5
MSRTRICLSLAAPLALCACGDASKTDAGKDNAPREGPLEGFVTVDRLPMPDDPRLLEGRTVWAGTCQACHGLGEAGSPKITDKKAWAPRIAKGIGTLREHALAGFIGPSGTMMPERGGNPELTDEQIFAAIDFMVANSR